MHSSFKRVVIRNNTEQQHNIHITVHPFPIKSIYMFSWKGDYGHYEDKELSQYQKSLADKLWDEIPGLHSMFFSNGNITLQHTGIFPDNDIYEVAVSIIQPVLEENLKLELLTEGLLEDMELEEPNG